MKRNKAESVYSTVIVVKCTNHVDPLVTHARLSHYLHAMEIDYGYFPEGSTRFKVRNWEVIPYRSNPELKDLRINGRWQMEEVALLLGELETVEEAVAQA